MSNIFPVVLKEMGFWKEARGKSQNKPKQIISLFMRKITAAGWASGMEWDRMVWPKPTFLTCIAFSLGLRVSQTNDFLDKNIIAALLPQTDE